MKKWIIWLSVFIILAAVGAGIYYYYFMKETETAGESPTAREVTAIKGEIVNQISGTGSVAANSRETVTAGKSGTIETVNFKVGDKVKAGQVLVTFEATDDYDDKISSIQKSIANAKLKITGYQESYKEATGTEKEDETKASLQKSMDEAEQEISDYEDELQDINDKLAKEDKAVLASIDGEITSMTVAAGDEVQSNTTVATIVDYTLLEFVTSVDELDIASVSIGQTADLTLSAITDKTIEGTVSEIAKEGTASNGSSSFSVSILLKDIEGVMAGMSGEAAITIESKSDIILVPVNAVVEMGGKSFVRVPTEGGETSVDTSGGVQQGGAPGQDGTTGGMQQGGAPVQDGTTGGKQQSGTPNKNWAGGSGQLGTSGSGTSGQRPAGAQGGATANGTGTRGDQAATGRQNGRTPNTLGGKLVEVTTGLSNETYVEIVTGLEVGGCRSCSHCSRSSRYGQHNRGNNTAARRFPWRRHGIP